MTGRLVAVNFVNLVELLLLFIVRATFSSAVFWMFCAVWLVQVVYTNYSVVKNDMGVVMRLNAASAGAFDSVVSFIVPVIHSLESRADVFETLDKDDRYMDVYEKTRKQFYSNIDVMIRYMKVYDKNSSNCASISKKVWALAEYNKGLVSKLNDVAEHVVTLDSTLNDTDTSAIDSLIEALKEVIDDE